jgi:hypothetical protein
MRSVRACGDVQTGDALPVETCIRRRAPLAARTRPRPRIGRLRSPGPQSRDGRDYEWLLSMSVVVA